ncbi:MAG: phosphoenolpyruvate--protein phosphotransferase [Lachnospiraceae bacterium]|jgi:phosphotransferase system enzyme I (PtsI)|nr:phosphoenolpyruvate--protein phosphotransferase [Lachnospiraceae bacterium]
MKTLLVEKTASSGFAMGRTFVVNRSNLNPDTYRIEAKDTDAEIAKYQKAVQEATAQLEALAKTSDIFAAHLEMVQDPALYAGVADKIISELQNVQLAVENTTAEFAAIFDSMDDEYMKERSADIRDIRNRLMRSLKGITQDALEEIHDKVILVAEDLTPSDTSKINLDFVLGFATELGGVTSHVSIIARNLELPALVGVKGLMEEVKNDDFLILDAANGKVILQPDEETIQKYKVLEEDYRKRKEELEALSSLPATTIDGRSVKVYANVGNLEDVKKAADRGIEGIGLFRSEFLYMKNTHFPTEEEQFEVYKEAAILCPKELIIRTLDIGGDKSLPYYTFEREDNPFLGWRAIRISLELENVFKAQLRAILRASAFGKVKIMYPMIISLEELLKANSILSTCKNELTAENIPFDSNIKVGIMIETPASVLCIENFAKYVDFFSIGTNDLTQYVLAVDRGNKKIAKLYDSFHPAVVQSIQRIIEAGHKEGIEVGMCGEFAGDENAAILLLGLGLDEFSMSAGATANIKNIIRNTSYEKAKECAEKAVAAFTTQEVKDILSSFKK